MAGQKMATRKIRSRIAEKQRSSLIFQNAILSIYSTNASAGIGTLRSVLRLPRLHRAGPSASLDKSLLEDIRRQSEGQEWRLV
jgi:hypothetical protein